MIRGDVERARRSAGASLALSEEHGLRLFAAMAAMVRGWALAVEDDPEAGASAVAAGLAAMESTGARMMRHFFFMLLADANRRAGRTQDALAAVTQGLAETDATTCFYAAELHRLQAELLLEAGAGRSTG